MLSFMEKEYRPHWKIRGHKDTGCYTGEPTDDPAYCHGKTIIGIDYGPVGGFERGYAYTLVRWMALQVGTRRTVFKEPKARFRKPVPCMTYDGDSPWPILVKDPEKVPESLRWCCVDQWGMRLHPSGVDDYMFELQDPDVYIKAIHEAQRKFGLTASDQATAKNRDLFWKARDEANRILWPQVKEILAPMWTEMKRLDAAWNAL